MAAPTDDAAEVLAFLQRRGFARALDALQSELGAPPGAHDALESFASKNGPGKAKDAALTAFRARVDPGADVEALSGLATFIEGSLDIYRPELAPVLLPIAVHIYLALVRANHRAMADTVLRQLGQMETDRELVGKLAVLRTPELVVSDPLAQRWLSNKYRIRMSKRGFGLFIGWLEGGGSTPGSAGVLESKGRDRILRIVNENLELITDPRPTAESEPIVDATKLDGLAREVDVAPPVALGLGPYPDEKLEREVAHETKDETGLTIEPPADLPVPDVANGPHYPTVRQLDIAREVSKLREGRKRIRLSAEAFAETGPARVPTGLHKPSACLFTVHDAGDALTATAISDDATLMATGFADSYVRVWSLRGDKLRVASMIDIEPNSINSASDLKKLKPRTASGQPSRKLIGHSGPVYGLAFDTTAGPATAPRHLLSASQDATVRLWSLDTHSCISVYRGHRDAIWAIEFGPRGIYFATASRDRTARLWTTERTTALRIFAGHLGDVECLKFHPNGLYLATGSSDRTCRIWDVQRGACVRLLTGHEGAVTSLAISPDGRYLASGSDDLTIKLWDIGTGRAIKTLVGHMARIDALAFSNESTVLMSGGADRTVRVWDVERREDGKVKTEPSALVVPEAALNATAQAIGAAYGDEQDKPSPDLLTTMLTRNTPIHTLKFTARNLALAVGPMQGPL